MGKNYKNNKKFFDTLYMNNATFIDYLERFRRIALSRFEWVNLPDSMNSRWLELCLFDYGRASLLKDPDFGYINTKCSNNGNINIYGLPSDLHCFSFEYQTHRKLYTGINEINGNDPEKEAVLVLNDWDSTPTLSMMELFAYRLYECDRTADVNIKSQKFPALLVCDEKQRLMMENLYEQYEGNTPVIFGDKNQFDEKVLRSINTQAPIILKQIDEHKREIWNEALTYLGINNINIEKKERAVVDEINSNNELVNLNLESFLAPRLKACKEFNDLFGLTGTDKEISVRVRSDLSNIIKRELSITKDYITEDEKEEVKEDEIDE